MKYDGAQEIEKEICKLEKNRKERLLEHLSYEKNDVTDNYDLTINEPKKLLKLKK